MLDTVAHSRLGLIDRRTPAIGARTGLTEGGLGLRLMLACLDGPPTNLAAYQAQVAPVADLIGLSTVVPETMLALAVTFADAPVLRRAGPVVLEILGYESHGSGAEAIALAHPLRFASRPVRLGVAAQGTAAQGTAARCTSSWRCHLDRTTSRGRPEALRRQLAEAGLHDVVVVDDSAAITDTVLSTVVALDPHGRLRPVHARCQACADLAMESIVDAVGAGLSPALITSPADLEQRWQGAWSIDPVTGVAEIAAVDHHPVRWTSAGHALTDRFAAALPSPEDPSAGSTGTLQRL